MKPRGLVLVTGITGSGKSTALAAMIQHINENRHANIITIEDPIEFLHRDINCHINQREVGTDTATLRAGAAPRAAPGSRRHPDRRDSRPRDARHRAQGGRHGPPRVLDAAHDGRDADDQPRAVVLSAAPAGRGALLARQRAAGGHLAAPRAARRQAGPRARRARCSSTPRPCATRSATWTKTLNIPDLIKEGTVQYGMQSFDQSLMQLVLEGRHLVRERAVLRDEPEPSSRCACRASPARATRRGTDSRSKRRDSRR